MGWLRRAIFGDLPLKLSALVCAGVLWVYVDGFVPVERTWAVPVRFFSPDGRDVGVVRFESRAREPSPVRTVKVTLRGPSRVMRVMRQALASTVAVLPERIIGPRVDLGGDGEDVLVRLLPQDFRFRRDRAHIVRIAPSEVFLRLGARTRDEPEVPR